MTEGALVYTVPHSISTLAVFSIEMCNIIPVPLGVTHGMPPQGNFDLRCLETLCNGHAFAHGKTSVRGLGSNVQIQYGGHISTLQSHWEA